MKDLLLMGTLMMRGVQPSFIARKIHVSRMRLCGDDTRGSSATTKVARLVWVLLVMLLVGRILVPMVPQDGAVWEQRLGVPVRCDGRHELQAEAAFHRLVEAPIPNSQAAVVVHLGLSSSKQIQWQGRRKLDLFAVRISSSPPSSWSPLSRQSLNNHFGKY
jgi:hypothetical protein